MCVVRYVGKIYIYIREGNITRFGLILNNSCEGQDQMEQRCKQRYEWAQLSYICPLSTLLVALQQRAGEN